MKKTQTAPRAQQAVLAERPPSVVAYNALQAGVAGAKDKLAEQNFVLRNLLSAVQANISAIQTTERELLDLEVAIRKLA